MQFFEAVESEWTSLPISEHDARALQAVGERLVPQQEWWGMTQPAEDSEGTAAEARSAVHCRMSAGGRWRVRVAERVGVIATRDVAIRVHPKIPADHALYLLHKGHRGLASALNIDDARVIAESAAGFWEVVCHALVAEAERVVSRDLARDYQLERDELSVVRGRVAVGPTTRKMLQGSLRLTCEFEEFSADVPINRYLKAASGAVVRTPLLSAGLRRRAMRVRAHMADIGELQRGDRRSILVDRRTAYYRDAIQLADLVMSGQAQTWREGASPGVAFLVRTPLLIQRGLQEVLNKALGSRWRARPEKVALGGISEWVNPDLVFGTREAVADVKYKRAAGEWNRGDLYEIVAFAEHLHTTKAAIFDFGHVGRPTVQVGDIAVTHVAWDATAADPGVAAGDFVAAVTRWLNGPT